MIQREYYKTREDGVMLFRTYSDTGHYLLQEQTGYIYEEAVDVEGAPFTYVETDEVIEQYPQKTDNSAIGR